MGMRLSQEAHEWQNYTGRTESFGEQGIFSGASLTSRSIGAVVPYPFLLRCCSIFSLSPPSRPPSHAAQQIQKPYPT